VPGFPGFVAACEIDADRRNDTIPIVKTEFPAGTRPARMDGTGNLLADLSFKGDAARV